MGEYALQAGLSQLSHSDHPIVSHDGAANRNVLPQYEKYHGYRITNNS